MSYFTKTDLQAMIKSTNSTIKKLQKTIIDINKTFDDIEPTCKSIDNLRLKTINNTNSLIIVLRNQIAIHNEALDKLKSNEQSSTVATKKQGDE